MDSTDPPVHDLVHPYDMSPLLREMVGEMVLRESNLMQKRFDFGWNVWESWRLTDVDNGELFHLLLGDFKFGIFVHIVIA